MSTRDVRRTGLVPVLLLSLLCPASAESLPQQLAEPAPAATSATRDTDDDPMLEAGEPVERDLSGGKSHAYRVRLDAGQLLVAVVERRGLSVDMATFAPDGTKIAKEGTFYRAVDPTTRVVADAAGMYRIEVKPEDSAQAGRYAIRVVEVRAATAEDRQLEGARRLAFEADELRKAGKFAEGIEAGERALAAREALLGPTHRDVAKVLDTLSFLYLQYGPAEKAEAALRRSLDLAERLDGPESAFAAEMLNRLAGVYAGRQEWAKALPLLQRALTLNEKHHGPESLGPAYISNNLASCYQALREPAKAEQHYERAVAIAEKLTGPESEHTALFLANLGSYYSGNGDFAKAEPILRRAAAADEKVFGPEHPYFASDLDVLSDLLADKGEYQEAEALKLRALAIREKVYGPDHGLVARTLNNLGYLYQKKEEPEKARPLFERTLLIYEKAHGPDSPMLAPTLLNVAQSHDRAGRFEEAVSLVERALAINRKAFGDRSPETIKDLSWLAKLSVATGDVSRAIEYQAAHDDARERMLRVQLAVGSERQKLAYLKVNETEFDQTLSLHAQVAPADATALRLALEMVLRRKGRTVDAVSGSVEALRRRASPEDRAALDELAEAYATLSERTLAGPGDQELARYREGLQALQQRVDALEGAVAVRSAAYRAESAPITLDAIRKAIPPGAALVEIARYRPFDMRAVRGERQFAAPRYVAYVLAGEGEPRWVELGDAARIDEAAAALRSALRDPKRADVRALARALDEAVMRPVRGLLGPGVRQLLVSPDGPLNLVPFEALEDERGAFLVERYAMSYLTSGRDLLRLGDHAANRSEPLVLANPDFVGGPLAASTRGVSMDAVRFRALPGTEAEARAIQRLLPDARVLTGPRATEAALGEVAGPKILHLATHGFFVEKTESAGDPGDEPEVSERMLRSGVALAGANRKGAAATLDGLVTALEFASLDLLGTKLVMLSACDTGLGEARAGEGVYGLRRALVLAGSETQVMSLWAVDDRVTRELMVAYYKELLAGAGRAEAMRRVQLKMLESPKTRHPAFWAAFIVSGDWRPLD